MIELIINPLSYNFMRNGLIAAVVVGILCAVIGCYVVLRSMAFLGDAMAHAILPGVAIAYLLKGNLMVGALIAAIVVALGISFFVRHGTIKEDTAIGILFSAALSLGVALISAVRSYAQDLSHILFGNVLGVSYEGLLLTVLVAAAILITLYIFYKPFLVISFDPILAATLRLNVGFYQNLMLILMALCIVVSIQTVGVGLVASMLVAPAASAYLLTRRLPAMMLVSAVIGGVSGVVGLYASYYVNISSGASIVLTSTIIFFAAYLFAPERGILRRLPLWR